MPMQPLKVEHGYDRLIALHKTPTFLALLSPKGDQNQFYPNNTWYVSHIRKKVIRIKKWPKGKYFDVSSDSLNSFFKEM